MIDRVAQALLAVPSVAIIPHINPDGDAIGSSLALMLALRAAGKRADVVSHNPVPPQYAFMPGAREVILAGDAGEYDAALVVDVSEERRIGDSARVYRRAATKLCIDHHTTSDPDFCALQMLDKHAAAAGNIVLSLIRAMGVPLTPAIAECLFVAVSTDTGNFNYSNVTGDTLRDAAALVDTGIDVNGLTRLLYRIRTLARTQLIGRAISSLRTHAGGRVASMRLSVHDYAVTGASDSDTEGIVNYAMELEGAHGAVLGRETEEGVKCSLRSIGRLNAAEVARRFGGGGHEAAAGCIIQGALDEAVNAVVEEMAAQLAMEL